MLEQHRGSPDKNLQQELIWLRRKHRDFFHELKSIPHLRIPLAFDFQKICAEVATIQSWEPVQIEGEFWSESARVFFGKNNQARALFEFIPDSRFLTDTNNFTRPPELCVYRSDGRLTYFPTDIASDFPETLKLLQAISDYPCRVRIAKIAKHYEIGWHSHHYDHQLNPEAPYNFGAFQLPVFTNANVFYDVKSSDPRFPEEFSLAYPAGELYFFNSYYLHRVRNLSDQERTTLFMNFDLEYEPTIEFLKPYVANYRGPRVRWGN